MTIRVRRHLYSAVRRSAMGPSKLHPHAYACGCVFARRAIRRLLDRELAAPLVADADDLFGCVEKDLAVTDGASSGIGNDGFDDSFDTIVFCNNLNL